MLLPRKDGKIQVAVYEKQRVERVGTESGGKGDFLRRFKIMERFGTNVICDLYLLIPKFPASSLQTYPPLVTSSSLTQTLSYPLPTG